MTDFGKIKLLEIWQKTNDGKKWDYNVSIGPEYPIVLEYNFMQAIGRPFLIHDKRKHDEVWVKDELELGTKYYIERAGATNSIKYSDYEPYILGYLTGLRAIVGTQVEFVDDTPINYSRVELFPCQFFHIKEDAFSKEQLLRLFE